MEISTTTSNQMILEMFKTCIKVKTTMDTTTNEFKYLTSTCWNEKHQPLTIDMTKDKYTGRYRLGLDSLFVPNTNRF